MNSQAAFQLLSSIDQTITDINNISGPSPLVDSYLAKFLVVYICGIYEEAIEAIIIDFVSKNSSRIEVVNYTRKSIDQTFRNPDSGKIILLAKNFFGASVYISSNLYNEKIAIDSIINNKNNIAHGRPSTITLSDVVDYYNRSRPLIEKFDILFS